MGLQDPQPAPQPVDPRIAAYRVLRLVLAAVLVALILKTGCVDTFPVATDQMSPTLINGDRVLVSKAAHSLPLGLALGPRKRHAVVFRHPLAGVAVGCLRVAGLPGDVVSAKEGTFHVNGLPEPSFSAGSAECTRLPAQYSPRDWMSPLRIPRRGESFELDTLPLRDFVFVAAMMRQENSRRTYRIEGTVHVDGAPASQYIISDFVLYKGTSGSIPDSLANNWFFWDRLSEYLRTTETERSVSLRLTLLEDGHPVSHYTVGATFCFMLADHWCTGLDSRYFGPVRTSSIVGRVACILWSTIPPGSGPGGLRPGRLFKIVN